MEIKIVCGCGTKYKFDVEPLEGRMPWPVRCPSCGVDGTAQANEIIQAGSPAPVSSPSVPVAPPLATGPRPRVRVEDSAAPAGEIPGRRIPPRVPVLPLLRRWQADGPALLPRQTRCRSSARLCW